jgi:hypothetical protein
VLIVRVQEKIRWESEERVLYARGKEVIPGRAIQSVPSAREQENRAMDTPAHVAREKRKAIRVSVVLRVMVILWGISFFIADKTRVKL